MEITIEVKTPPSSVVLVLPGAWRRWHIWIVQALLNESNVASIVARPSRQDTATERQNLLFGSPGWATVRPATIERELAAYGERFALDGGDSEPAAEHWTFSLGLAGGRQPLFTEIAQGRHSFTASLRSAGQDGPAALQAARFKVHYSYGRTLDGALREMSGWPAKVVRLRGAGLKVQASFDPGTASSSVPRTSPPLLYAVRSAWNLLHTLFVYFFIEARWNVAVAEGQLTFPFRTSELRWLPADSSAFIADPIAVSVDGCRAVFCELFPYKSRKGSIAVISVDDETRKPTTVIEQPRHLSYPFIVQDGTETYCIPEDSQSRRVTLYRAKRFPFEWEEAGVLLEDVPAVDPTIFYDGERWWLFATRADREPNLNLFAWHAPTLQGPWSAHLANPIKTDISGARPAGKLFRIAGDVYRPAQDCARSYGHAVTVHRIVELSPSSFFEERVARLTPIAPYSNGIHTLSSAQDFFAVDGRRDYIDLRKPWRVWRERRLRRP